MAQCRTLRSVVAVVCVQVDTRGKLVDQVYMLCVNLKGEWKFAVAYHLAYLVLKYLYFCSVPLIFLHLADKCVSLALLRVVLTRAVLLLTSRSLFHSGRMA